MGGERFCLLLLLLLTFMPMVAAQAAADSDKDGIPDEKDNCPTVYNPDQKDANQNRIGDACEVVERDSDQDGVPDAKDNCQLKYNPKQEDIDKDGVGDACDNCRDVYNAGQRDSNQNGIGDACEVPAQTPAPAQNLPDLVVQEITCSLGNRLSFNAANIYAPMPSGWAAVAEVYFDGMKMGSVDLGRPTGGDITYGSANYLTSFEISKPVEVKIVVDPTNSVREANEGNNAKVAKVAPCAEVPVPAKPSEDECIKKYMDAYKLSYEEAKERCYLPTPTSTVSPVEGCIKKYQELGYPYEEAKKACTAQPAPPDRCTELKQKLLALEEELKKATPEEAKGIQSDIEIVRKDLLACEKPLTCEEKAKLSFDKCILTEKDEKACRARYEKWIQECKAPTPKPVDRCTELKERLVVLAGGLQKASPDEVEAIRAEIDKIKPELSACEVKRPSPVVDRCAELKKTLLMLEEELRKTSPEEAEKISSYFGELVAACEKPRSACEEKMKVEFGKLKETFPEAAKKIFFEEMLTACEKPEVTPGVKNPCDEVRILKESLEQLNKKIAYLKESIAKGEMNESALEPYYKEADYLQGHLDRMSFACQQGKPVEESPCARLSKLEVVYMGLQERLGASKDEKEAAALREKLEAVTTEIRALKEKCRAASIQAEKPESVLDIEKIYETKVREAVESQSRGGLPNELRKIGEEKEKLIEEFAARAGELDLRRTTIIKKTKIAGDEVSLDDIKTKVQKVEVDVEGKDLEIDLKPGEVAITQGDATARGNVALEYSEGRLTGGESGKPIKVLPSDAKDKATAIDDDITWGIEIDDDITWGPRYIARGDRRGRLLGIVPVTVPRTLEIGAEKGEIIKDTKPWWSFAVRYPEESKKVETANVTSGNATPELLISPQAAQLLTRAPREQGIRVDLANWWRDVPPDQEIGIDPLLGGLYLYWLDEDGNICPIIEVGATPYVNYSRVGELRTKMRNDERITVDELRMLQSDTFVLSGDGAYLIQYGVQIWRDRSLGTVFEDFSNVQFSLPMDVYLGEYISPASVQPADAFGAPLNECFTPTGGLPVPSTGLESDSTRCRTRQNISASALIRACSEGRLQGGISEGYFRVG